jgi:hypothetical protein
MRFIPPVSLPGLTGQSSIPDRWLLDRPVKPGDDTTEVGQLIERRCSDVQSVGYMTPMDNWLKPETRYLRSKITGQKTKAPENI